ncbi:hypothetical protein ACFFQW_05540 [Umezawaea endophytica]|uniref:Uncharacterized protein n=1 Tax=Umezawaea endophytica TaxID=1654476 RepID=A0A9X2VGT2_9PSEU|nr:hypothetical protein [Umezawaea endophytica]MCS7476164.1 hypothetical protein [Umezawaea endophytica]
MAPTEKERLDVVEPAVAGLDTEAKRLDLELRRVSARLLVLERRLSGAGAGLDEDLDAVDEEIADVVEALRKAWDAEQEVLADSVRVRVRQEVAEFEELKARREAGRRRLEAGRKPKFERESIGHEIHQLDWHIGARQSNAQEAADRLAADERATQEAWRLEAIVAGEKAREEIWAAARSKIDRALAADLRLPVWFRIGLGEIICPDPAPWLLAATGLVAYRLEYGVTDPVRPLGPIPSASSGSAAWVRRTEVYGDVSEQMKGLRL